MKIEWMNGQEYRDGKPVWWVYVKSPSHSQCNWIAANSILDAKTIARTKFCTTFGNAEITTIKGGKFKGGGC